MPAPKPVSRPKSSVKKKTSPGMRAFKRIAAVLLLLGLIGGVTFGVIFGADLKKAEAMVNNMPDKLAELQKKPTRVVTSDGRVIYTASNEYRESVPLDKIPKRVQDAVIAAEDKRFWQHSGVDYWSIMRAVFTLGKRGGGSTLTMQLAKRLYTSTEKSFARKIQDMALAVTIEKRMKKEEILDLYLNQVYFGSGAYGIKAAAKVYFGRDNLNDLTLSEAATLARCVQLPNVQNPFANKQLSIQKRNEVLEIMLQENMIDQKQFDEAEKDQLSHLAKKERFISGHVIYQSKYAVQHILAEAKRLMPDIDLDSGGWTIETTLNGEIQDTADKAVAALVRKYRSRKVTWGAFLLMDRQGKILAEVGGADYDKNQYNVITQGRRQPGSSFKPILYYTAFATGNLRPGDMISNETFTYTDPYTGKTWTPKNDSDRFPASVTIDDAIRHSINIPAVRTMEKTGPKTVVEYAHDKFGFTSPLDPVLPLALGSSAVSPLEMARAYSCFMLRGDRATPFIIRRIISPDGEETRFDPEITQGAIDPKISDQIDFYLREVVTGGTGSKARIVSDARGKTGTTSDNRDAWFCGYTDNLLAVGWVGNPVYHPNQSPPITFEEMSSSVFGGTVTVEMWAQVLKHAERMLQRGQLIAKKEQVHLKRELGGDWSVPDAAPPDDSGDQDDSQAATTGGAPTTPQTGATTGTVDSTNSKTLPTKKPADDTGNESTPPSKTETTPPVVVTPVKTEDKYVDVDICIDTNLRATKYCPNTITRRFKKGTEPKRFCKIHSP